MLKSSFRFGFILLFSLMLSGSVFAGPIEEKRTANFNLIIEIDNDLNPAPTGVSLQDVVPGKSYKGKLVIENQDDIEAEYSVRVYDGVVDDGGEFVFKKIDDGKEGGGDANLGSWVTVDQTKGIIVKGQSSTVDVPFVVKVPNGSSPGDYVARISVVMNSFSEDGVSPSDVTVSGQTRVSVLTAKGSLISFNVTGDVFYDLQINTASWVNKIGEGYHVEVGLENKSNVSVRPIIFVDVKDSKAESVYSQRFILEQSIFPDAKMVKDLSLKELKELPYGRYDVNIEAYYLSDYDFIKFGEDLKQDKIGKDSLAMAGSATFAAWILPLTVIYSVTGVIVALIVMYLLWFYVRRMRNKN